MQVVTNNDLSKLHEYTKVQDNQKLIKANQFTREILETICQYVKPGIKESELIKHCYDVYEQNQVDRIWHKPFIRFGKNTITTFRDIPAEDIILAEEDIAYVDIGIVKDGIEGDAGKTFHFGSNPMYAEIVELTESLFFQARKHWQDNKTTGIELYQFIEKQANAKGYECNLKPAGHLIGSFPHASAKYKNGLSNFPEVIEAYQWILEIQIRHPTLEVGGFYEAILG
jgi:methionine aminopeptidase